VGVRVALGGGLLALSLLAAPTAQTDPRGGLEVPSYQTEYLSHDAARPVFEALGERLPSASAWQEWIAAADSSTRARVRQGDEISVVNLLLFGTSFTNEPRITSAQLDDNQIAIAVAARLMDFERALDAVTRRDLSSALPVTGDSVGRDFSRAVPVPGDSVGRDFSRAVPVPGDNERLAFARGLLGEGAQVRPRLLSLLQRATAENETLARLIGDARALGDPSLQFAERSRIYRTRGLSSDTTVRTNFAVEEALRGLISVRGSDAKIRRIAIIGPGLDFTDKQEGYDFYPPQTIQPFALIDSLVRLDLAHLDDLSVTTLDLSTRVNDHIERAVWRARNGWSYVFHLPVAGNVSWKPEFLRYWQTLGDTIGGQTTSPRVPPAAGPVKIRSVDVRPSVVGRITARDVNIVAEHLTLADAERFDLILATNVFVYYDLLQQGLAMRGVSNMLRPGGFLLSNNALVEVPSTGLRSIGYSKTLYSEREEDGDLIVWYRRADR
jgi:hypothetical protein